MVKVTLEDLDSLCNGLHTLFVLTYLQSLTLESDNFVLFEGGGLRISRADASAYLWEQQYQTLSELKLTIEKDGFSAPLDL